MKLPFGCKVVLVTALAAVSLYYPAFTAVKKIGKGEATYVNLEKYADGYIFGRVVHTDRPGWPIRRPTTTLQVGDVGGTLYYYKRQPPDDLHVSYDPDSEHFSPAEKARIKFERKYRVKATPWELGSLTVEQKELEQYANQLVMIHYFTRQFKDPFLTTANEWIETIKPRSANFKPLRYEVNNGQYNLYNRGHQFGRVVQVAYQGWPIIKTWEAVIQIGEHGRHFMAMSFRDRRMARYAILAMHSNVLLRFDFTEIGVPVLDPLYRAWGGVAGAWGPEGFKISKVNPFAVFRFQESEFDIYAIEQTVLPATNPDDLMEVPEEIFTNDDIDIDMYMQEQMGG